MHWSLAIFVVCIVICGCNRNTNPGPMMSNFLALGDSYTIGESVAPGERWPMQLAKMLREQGIKIDDPLIIGRTGWTTDELSAAMDEAKIDGRKFELVTLLIGVNNQFRGRSTEEYRTQFVALLKRAVALAGGRPGRVIVLSIPDWGVTPFGQSSGRDVATVAAEIDRFNGINRDESAASGVRYVDVTPISRGSTTQPSLVAPDGLHPSGGQYELWARQALPIVINALRN